MLAVCASASAADGVPVATASVVKGTVAVNHGNKFVPLDSGQALMPGDRVMAGQLGSATVTFSDGCVLQVSAMTMITVPATSTCAGGIAQVQRVAPSSTGAIGASRGVDWAAFWTIVGPIAAIDYWLIHEYPDEVASP